MKLICGNRQLLSLSSFPWLLVFLFLLPATPARAQLSNTTGQAAMVPGDKHWSTMFSNPSFGFVKGVAADGEEVFITGRFRLGDGKQRPKILRWSPNDGSLEVIGRPQVLPNQESRGWVGPVIATEDVVFVGGYFNVGDGPARVAAWDRTTHTWTAMDDGLEYTVVDLAYDHEGRLFALTRYIVNRTAPWYGKVYRWNGASWTPLGGSFEGYPTAIAARGSDVFIALLPAAGDGSYEVRRWTGNGWETIGEADWREGGYASGTVETLALDEHGSLYAGGHFVAINDISASNIARWDGENWHPLGEGLGGRSSATVHDLAVSDGVLYAVGRIDSAGGRPVKNIAMWNGDTWKGAGQGTNGDVFHVALTGNQLYVAGSFELAGQTVAHNIAMWNKDAGDWSPLYKPEGKGIRGTVTAVAIQSSEAVVIGGYFATAGNVWARNVALWNGRSWSALGEGVAGDVDVVAINESEIYVGGTLNLEGDSLSYGLAVWNDETSRWDYIGEDTQGRRLVRARSLLLTEDRLYVTGKLQAEGDRTLVGLFAWEDEQWSVLGQVQGDKRNPVAMRVAAGPNNLLYLGGRFTTIEGIDARNIARWDGEAWEPLGHGLPHPVSALAAANGYLYAAAGRVFEPVIGANDSLYIWSEASGRWSAVESGLQPPPGCTGAINTIEARGDEVYVGGGSGICMTGKRTDYSAEISIAKWTGQTWEPLGSGIQGQVYALALQGSDLYVGGSFAKAGGHSSLSIAHWNEKTILPIPSLRQPKAFRLYPNYPNPFNPQTIIGFSLPEPTHVSVVVYDVMGRLVGRLVDRPMPAGYHEVQFDGSELPSGLYFYRLQAEGYMQSKPMLLLK